MKKRKKKRLTVAQYAELKGCSTQNVYKRIRRGTVEYEKIGKTILVLI